jgi:hypothetical protein
MGDDERDGLSKSLSFQESLSDDKSDSPKITEDLNAEEGSTAS